jgi:Surp module/CID domain
VNEQSSADVAIPPGAVKLQVELPTDTRLRTLIDAVANAIAQHGQIFEEAVMDEYGRNEHFSFLFDTDTAEHRFYRWRVYSLCMGDSLHEWRTSPYQMVLGGPFWVPPTQHSVATQPLISTSPPASTQPPSASVRQDIERRLQNLTIERDLICDSMVFILDHASEASEIAFVIARSFSDSNLPVSSMLARLYLVSDILHNAALVKNGSVFRSCFLKFLPRIFKHLGSTHRRTRGRITAMAMKDKVCKVLRVWQVWAIFPPHFCAELEQVLTSDTMHRPRSGAAIVEASQRTTVSNNTPSDSAMSSTGADLQVQPTSAQHTVHGDGEDIDGEDIDGEDIDGEDIDGEDIDGEDIDGEDIDGEDIDGEELMVNSG